MGEKENKNEGTAEKKESAKGDFVLIALASSS
jgi:hypothetical protein